MAGRSSGNGLAGFGGHLFWRDPNRGLLGANLSRLGSGGNFTNPYGVEAEYYSQRWTLGAAAGGQTGLLGNTPYARLVAKYYATDNLKLEVSGNAFSSTRIGQLGVEWQPDVYIKSVSLFAFGGVGSNNLDYALGGVKWYFGRKNKSLKSRHREADPDNLLLGATAGAAAAKSVHAAVKTPTRNIFVCPPGTIFLPAGL